MVQTGSKSLGILTEGLLWNLYSCVIASAKHISSYLNDRCVDTGTQHLNCPEVAQGVNVL